MSRDMDECNSQGSQGSLLRQNQRSLMEEDLNRAETIRIRLRIRPKTYSGDSIYSTDLEFCSSSQNEETTTNLKLLYSSQKDSEHEEEGSVPITPKSTPEVPKEQIPKLIGESVELDFSTVGEVLEMDQDQKDLEENGEQEQQNTVKLATCLDGLVVDEIICGAQVDGVKYFLAKFKNVKDYMLIRIEDANINFAQDVIKYYESQINWCDSPGYCHHSPAVVKIPSLHRLDLTMEVSSDVDEIKPDLDSDNSEQC